MSCFNLIAWTSTLPDKRSSKTFLWVVDVSVLSCVTFSAIVQSLTQSGGHLVSHCDVNHWKKQLCDRNQEANLTLAKKFAEKLNQFEKNQFFFGEVVWLKYSYKLNHHTTYLKLSSFEVKNMSLSFTLKTQFASLRNRTVQIEIIENVSFSPLCY